MNGVQAAVAAEPVEREVRAKAHPRLRAEEVSLRELGRELPYVAARASTVFGTPLWMETVLRNKRLGGAFRARAVVAKDRESISGVLLGHSFTMPGLKAFFSPLPRTMSQYGGLSVMPEYAGSQGRVTELLLSKVRESYDLGLVITPPGHRLPADVGVRGWSVYPRKTLVVDLTKGKDEVWGGVHGQARKGIKRATKNDVRVDFVGGAGHVRGFFEILAEVGARADWDVPFGEAFFRDALAKFRGSSVVARALSGDEFVAGALLFFDDRTVYCHSYAASERGRKLQASDLLQWSIISWAKERGFSAYDLLGANIPRIAHFKRSFGAADVGYDLATFCKNPLIARLERRVIHGML